MNEELDRSIAAVRAQSSSSAAGAASPSGRGHGVDMLPLVQRTALRVMFRYLTVRAPASLFLAVAGRLSLVSIIYLTTPRGPTSSCSGGERTICDRRPALCRCFKVITSVRFPCPLPPQGASGTSGQLIPPEIEDAYIASATALRAIIPARARSIFALVPDWLYRLTPLGRAEAAAVATASALTVCFPAWRVHLTFLLKLCERVSLSDGRLTVMLFYCSTFVLHRRNGR